MFTRIEVENFQSIAKADLELAPFTVIVGPSGLGKTAILRALTALLTNKSGTAFIREGQNTCNVRLETDDGHCIEWHKNKTTATYTVDGQQFTKLARAIPPEVFAATGVRAFDVDGTTTLWPQLHRQGEFAFLVPPHLSSGQAARAIAKLTRLDIVVKAQQLCKAVLRQLSNDVKQAESSIEATKQELNEFEGLDADKKFLEDVTRERKSLGADVARFTDASMAVAAIQDAEQMADQYIPTSSEIAEITSDINMAADARRLVEALQEPLPPDVPDLSPVISLLEHLQNTHEYCLAVSIDKQISDEQTIRGQELDRINRTLEDLQGQACPTCGKPL